MAPQKYDYCCSKAMQYTLEYKSKGTNASSEKLPKKLEQNPIN